MVYFVTPEFSPCATEWQHDFLTDTYKFPGGAGLTKRGSKQGVDGRIDTTAKCAERFLKIEMLDRSRKKDNENYTAR